MTSDFTRTKSELNWAFLIAGQCGVPACAEGAPGIGKTETLKCLAAFTRRQFFSYELSRTQPEDLQGFPVVGTRRHHGEELKFMQFVPDERLLSARLEPSILLLDEISNVIAPKQAAALNLIQNPPANCWMYMACNPMESSADGQPLTPPFINRIWMGQWEIDVEAQNYGLTHNLTYPPPDVPIVPSDYRSHTNHWGAIIHDYLSSFPKDRNACPENRADKHKPWPSSRQWHNLCLVLSACTAVRASNETRDKLVMGLVGHEVGPQFIEYVDTLQLPRPSQLLQSPSIFKQYDRYDIQYSLTTSVCNYLHNLSEEARADHVDQAYKLLEVIESVSGDLGEALASTLGTLFPEYAKQRDLAALSDALTRATDA